MGRPMCLIETLHGYTLEKLVDMKNKSDSKYTRMCLETVILRYQGYTNSEITKITGLLRVAILKHIKNWNLHGIKSTKETRGGLKPSKLTPDIVDDLLYVVKEKSPVDFKFIGHKWTLSILSLYIKYNYDIDISGVSIRTILKKNNLSYKKAQPKPTKANKLEQEEFKKNIRNTRYIRKFI